MSSTEIAPISELSNAELDEVGGGFLRFNRNQIVVANQQNIATEPLPISWTRLRA